MNLEFIDKVLSKYKGYIDTEIVFQAIDALPEGYKCPEGREKPWGTNHAVLMGKDVIKEPFAVYMQGGLTYSYGKLGIKSAISFLEKENLLKK